MMMVAISVAIAGCSADGENKNASAFQTSNEATFHPEGTASWAALSEERMGQLQGGISFRNQYPIEGMVIPGYARFSSTNGRYSVADVRVFVFNESGESIHDSWAEKIHEVTDAIYGWDPDQWQRGLSEAQTKGGTLKAEAVLQEKSDMFWEFLGQQVAERLFGQGPTSLVYTVGPRCAAPPGCSRPPGLPGAAVVVVKTKVEGSSDPLYPVTRTIYTAFRQDDLSRPAVLLHVEVPAKLKVNFAKEASSPTVIDYRPTFGTPPRPPKGVDLFLYGSNQARIKNKDYPDYNLVFVPWRHFLLEGKTATSSPPGTTLHYENVNAFFSSAKKMSQSLWTAKSAKWVVPKIKPFFTTSYYPMFDQDKAVQAQFNHLVNAQGLPRGVADSFQKIRARVRFQNDEAVVDLKPGCGLE